MVLNLIETLNTSIYNPKHTNNTKIHFQKFKFSIFQKSIISKILSSNKSVFYADVHGPPWAGLTF